MAPEPLAGGRRRLLAAIFLASGAAGLIDQVVWLRYLSLTFGNTTLATATLLAVFLGGLGAGAFAFARWLRRARFSRLTAYALLELAIGLFALLSPRLFGLIDQTYIAVYRATGDQPALFVLLRVALAALCLAPPTFLMGGTLPVLLDAVRSGRGREGADTALYYGANTLGAVAGVAVAGFFTIRLFGLHASLLLAASINFVAALAVVLISSAAKRSERTEYREVALLTAGVEGAASPRFLLAVAFGMGAASIACEVLWTRILVFYLGSSVYAFSLMLFLFLLGIAGGSFAAGRIVDRIERPLLLLARLELALALFAPLSIWLFATLNQRQIALSEALEPQRYAAVLVAQLLAVAPILLPPTLLMGFTFPVMVRAYSEWRRTQAGATSVGTEVGEIYGANTAGSIAGALAAGFALVPLLGSQNALLAVGAGNALLAFALARREAVITAVAGLADSEAAPAPSRRVRLPSLPVGALAVLALLAVAAALLPRDRAILAAGVFARDRPGDLVHFAEDADAAVAVRRREERGPSGALRPWISLELNGVNVAGTSPDLFAVQKMQGHLPLLLARRAGARVVHIGFGSGGTAHAVSLHPVAEIRIVEISRAVLAASDRYFAGINHGVLADPRVRTEINDGRNFLLATAERFDAVLSDSIHPRYAGNGSLYSEEYFRLVDRRLEPGGVVSMWLPMYSLSTSNYAMILAAFREVFPQTAVWYEPSALNSFTVVTARKGDAPWDVAAVAAGFADPAIRRALAEIDIRDPLDLYAGALLSRESLDRFLGDTPPHVDDLPAVEYESGAILAGNWSWRQNFEALLDHRPAEPPGWLLEQLPDSERGVLRERWAERGRALAAHRAFLAANVTPWS